MWKKSPFKRLYSNKFSFFDRSNNGIQHQLIVQKAVIGRPRYLLQSALGRMSRRLSLFQSRDRGDFSLRPVVAPSLAVVFPLSA